MSITVVPNSGILRNDMLDRLRGDAILASSVKGLPEPVVYYIRALESAYMEHEHQRRKAALAEIKWTFDPSSAEQAGQHAPG